MPDNPISQQSAQSRYNLRNSKRAGVKNDNSAQPDVDRQYLNTNKEANDHESTGEPSQPGGTRDPSQPNSTGELSQASGTPMISQASGTGIPSQAGSTGIASQAGDSVGIPLSAEISRGLIARGMLNNQPTPEPLVTDEEMEQAGFGDLSPEFRARAQNSWFLSAFVKGWDSVGWND